MRVGSLISPVVVGAARPPPRPWQGRTGPNSTRLWPRQARPPYGSRRAAPPPIRISDLSETFVVAAGQPSLGSALLYLWPDEGWQYARAPPPARDPLPVAGASFTHVAYAGEINTLLDPATSGSRRVSQTRVAPLAPG